MQSSFLPELIGLYQVEVIGGHRVFEPGTRFTVVEERGSGWLLCYQEGKRVGGGTFVAERFVKRVVEKEDDKDTFGSR